MTWFLKCYRPILVVQVMVFLELEWLFSITIIIIINSRIHVHLNTKWIEMAAIHFKVTLGFLWDIQILWCYYSVVVCWNWPKQFVFDYSPIFWIQSLTQTEIFHLLLELELDSWIYSLILNRILELSCIFHNKVYFFNIIFTMNIILIKDW